MVSHDLDLFCENYSTINQHYQKQIHFIPLILLNCFDIFAKEIQKNYSIISSVSLPIVISILSRLEYIILVSSESLEEIKLVVVVN